MRRRSAPTLAAALLALAAQPAAADPQVRATALFDEQQYYWLTGQTTALTSDSFLAFRASVAAAPDPEIPWVEICVAGEGGVELALVRHLGADEPEVTPIPLPFDPSLNGGVVRLSPTRVLVASDGPDLSPLTDDDVVLLVDRIGTENTVTPLAFNWSRTFGWLGDPRLGDDAAILLEQEGGPPANAALLTDLGGANTLTLIPGEFTQAVAVDSNRFLLVSNDTVRVYDRSATIVEEFPLVEPSYSFAARLGPVSFLDVPHDTSEDPRVGLLDELDSVPTFTEIALPGSAKQQAPTRLGGNRFLVFSQGPEEHDLGHVVA